MQYIERIEIRINCQIKRNGRIINKTIKKLKRNIEKFK